MDNDTTVIERLRDEQWSHLLPGTQDVWRRAKRRRQHRLSAAAASLAIVAAGSAVAATQLRAGETGNDIGTAAAPVSSEPGTARTVPKTYDPAAFSAATGVVVEAGDVVTVVTSFCVPASATHKDCVASDPKEFQVFGRDVTAAQVTAGLGACVHPATDVDDPTCRHGFFVALPANFSLP